MKPQPRSCERCGKTGGVFSFALREGGRSRAGYWHPSCHRLAKLEADQ